MEFWGRRVGLGCPQQTALEEGAASWPPAALLVAGRGPRQVVTLLPRWPVGARPTVPATWGLGSPGLSSAGDQMLGLAGPPEGFASKWEPQGGWATTGIVPGWRSLWPRVPALRSRLSGLQVRGPPPVGSGAGASRRKGPCWPHSCPGRARPRSLRVHLCPAASPRPAPGLPSDRRRAGRALPSPPPLAWASGWGWVRRRPMVASAPLRGPAAVGVGCWRGAGVSQLDGPQKAPFPGRSRPAAPSSAHLAATGPPAGAAGALGRRRALGIPRGPPRPAGQQGAR